MSAKKNYFEALRNELLYLIEKELSPIAQNYGYSDTPLESKIKWKPLVLLLGNYSSGKSTFINEFFQESIQDTGQAPTDDAFTVITGYQKDSQDDHQEIIHKDGRAMLYDPMYPFAHLKKHGEQLASHFRCKMIPSDLLAERDFAIIDTPGMLDSVSEKGRGYDYQAVVGDLAQLADLILIFFDPHKAGTIKESYASLRYTLPQKTFEDRVIFVLNRVDECSSLEDLLRVYGTLCWNLSQMLGRKDMPKILLTFSYKKLANKTGEEAKYLELLKNQRDELYRLITQAPKHRLDHLATYLEYHTAHLLSLIEVLMSFAKKRRNFIMKYSLMGLVVSLSIGALVSLYVYFVSPFGSLADDKVAGIGFGVTALVYMLSQFFIYKVILSIVEKNWTSNIEHFVSLETKQKQESFDVIRPILTHLFKDPELIPSLSRLKKEKQKLYNLFTKATVDMRSAISQLKEK